MAMLIFALASFSNATELPSESSCFDCKKVVETKNPYWPCAGLKVNFRKVSQEAASEASNTDLLLSSREAHEFKDCLHRVERLEEELELSQEVSGTIGLALPSVSRCLDTLMKHSHSFLKYCANVTINKKE